MTAVLVFMISIIGFYSKYILLNVTLKLSDHLEFRRGVPITMTLIMYFIVYLNYITQYNKDHILCMIIDIGIFSIISTVNHIIMIISKSFGRGE